MATRASELGPADYVPSGSKPCPNCGKPLERMRRQLSDRIVSLFRPVQRYRCRNFSCRWEGTLPTQPREGKPTVSE